MKLYGLYDSQDNDCLIMVGTSKELARYLRTSTHVVYCMASRRCKIENRYELVVFKEA